VVLFFIHGTCWLFLLHGLHELAHNTVFRTKSFNGLFLRIFAFLTWFNHHQFWVSHTEHHKYTLHPPDDLEVIFPVKLTLKQFLLRALVNPIGLWIALSATFMMACGRARLPWHKSLFAQASVHERRKWVNWARFLLTGHATIIVVSVVMRWWLLPVVTTLAPFYGGWLCYLCNNTQHSGLQDNVADFRLCCRTITLNPVLGFLYWHMNYHTEHHMYAAVPCYNLAKLHEIIKSDLPPCPDGLLQTWKQLGMILRRQKLDSAYQHVPQLPTPSR
jgi:fatty acid desaturase